MTIAWQQALERAFRHPGTAFGVARMWLRGSYYRVKYRFTGQRVRIGRNFRVIGRLDIKGSGLVIFGDDCTVISSTLAPVTPYTNASHAVIHFGDRVVLNGTRFSCQHRIEIGSDSLLADARICDSDFHAVQPHGRHRWNTTAEAKPVHVGPNVWICAGAMVLKGVTMGADSVVGAGAVVTRSVPPATVVAGNPARPVRGLKTPAYERWMDMPLKAVPSSQPQPGPHRDAEQVLA